VRRRSSLPLAALAALAALAVVAACSGSAGSEARSAAPTGAGDGTRIEVRLRDSFRIEPGDFTVPAGEPVTFVVTNSGVLDHEFYVGDEAAHADHDKEMLSGGMGHDDPNGVAVDPGETKELTITFDAAASLLAACHVPGHYAGGMKTSLAVTE
jgi:uncharacterized cupredoxin-like copper-binding protein